MRCADCRDALGAYTDRELMLPEQQEIRDHLAGCAECAREHDKIAATVRSLREGLVRHTAPDVLKARIRSSLAAPDAAAPAAAPLPAPKQWSSWMRLAAAGLFIAAASSSITLLATRQGSSPRTTETELLASHVRSLMPGHLTDVASTNQHNVKPWFNGRVDFSPTVPSLDSAGFPLVGGRLDYVDGRPVAAVVYTRRQHVINVYSWPSSHAAEASHGSTVNGYHFVRWENSGIELWAVSDLNLPELEQFVSLFRGDENATKVR